MKNPSDTTTATLQRWTIQKVGWWADIDFLFLHVKVKSFTTLQHSQRYSIQYYFILSTGSAARRLNFYKSKKWNNFASTCRIEENLFYFKDFQAALSAIIIMSRHLFIVEPKTQSDYSVCCGGIINFSWLVRSL